MLPNTLPPTRIFLKKRLIASGHIKRLETIEEDCFSSNVVVTVEKLKSAKVVLDSEKLQKTV